MHQTNFAGPGFCITNSISISMNRPDLGVKFLSFSHYKWTMLTFFGIAQQWQIDIVFAHVLISGTPLQ